ncbi:MAG: hypothetical protein ABL961_05700, partial [Vicinamibacterales bacterium]
ELSDLSVWSSFLRMLDPASTFEATAGLRTTGATLLPSAGDTPVTAAQDRRLSTATANARFTRSLGLQLLRAGADLQRFPVAERFSMGLTSAAFNAAGFRGLQRRTAAVRPHARRNTIRLR